MSGQNTTGQNVTEQNVVEHNVTEDYVTIWKRKNSVKRFRVMPCKAFRLRNIYFLCIQHKLTTARLKKSTVQ